MGEMIANLDAQAVVILIGFAVQTTVMAGVFFRLGGIGARLDGHGDRIGNIETRLG